MNRVSKLFYATGADRMPMPISAASSRRTRATVLKARQSRPKKVDTHIPKLAKSAYNLKELVPAERRVLDAKQDFELVSFPVKLVKSEVARFEQERIEDLKEPRASHR
ncbi:hypothetical protein BGY98DRAFT_1129069 [Russula aff. rugulosa BPL654]|nr:hypothetical protein BGY98DRAFT_1129069 [Russula aff. rugulosa BPL654]